MKGYVGQPDFTENYFNLERISTPSQRNYYRNLDTIRCFAALFVVVYHWLPGKMGQFPLAKIGVDFFFVLSGFLITEILLRQSRAAAERNSEKWKSIGKFYAKRALRIFPIYFLMITVFFLINDPPLGRDWVYLFTYTTNFLIFWKQQWIYPLSHTWTLAVEEQFYIIWPFLIFFFHKGRRAVLIATVIIGSIVYIYFISLRNEFFFVSTFSCISTLGTGGLLAYLKNERENIFERIKPYSLTLFLAFSLLFLISWRWSGFLVWHISIAAMAFFLITYSISTQNRLFNKTFSNPVTSYLGKISYGLYLYHHPIPWLVRNLNKTENSFTIGTPKLLPAFTNGYLILLENMAVLLAISSLSWFLLEKPVNSLKSRFE